MKRVMPSVFPATPLAYRFVVHVPDIVTRIARDRESPFTGCESVLSVWGKSEQACDVLWSNHRTNGWVLETSELRPYAGGGRYSELKRFADKAAVATKGKIEASRTEDGKPALTYTTDGGRRLEMTFRPFGKPYPDQHRIDGAVVDYRRFPLMSNSWVRQDVDGDILTLTHGGATRTYAFANWTVR